MIKIKIYIIIYWILVYNFASLSSPVVALSLSLSFSLLTFAASVAFHIFQKKKFWKIYYSCESTPKKVLLILEELGHGEGTWEREFSGGKGGRGTGQELQQRHLLNYVVVQSPCVGGGGAVTILCIFLLHRKVSTWWW